MTVCLIALSIVNFVFSDLCGDMYDESGNKKYKRFSRVYFVIFIITAIGAIVNYVFGGGA